MFTIKIQPKPENWKVQSNVSQKIFDDKSTFDNILFTAIAHPLSGLHSNLSNNNQKL